MSLELRQVGLRAGRDTIIDDVSLVLERGSMTVLLGPTLAGKTTLMRLMAGLDRPSSGAVLLDGRDVTGLPVRKRSVAMVYQQFVNYPSLSVYQNIASPLRVAGVAAPVIQARVAEAARLLRLDGLLDRLPAQLSGGQQQRTALARALVKRADLTLLDEPLANLDYKLREELREQLPQIFAASGSILVYATTEPTEALLLGASTVTLSQGRVTQHGGTQHIYRHPDNLQAARVFSDPPLNELTVEKIGAILRSADRTMPAGGPLAQAPDGRYTVAFRCEDAAIGAPGENRAATVFPGTVAVTELSGSENFVHVDVGFATWVCLLDGLHQWQPGAAASVYVDLARSFAFDAAGAAIGAPFLARTA